MVVALRAKKGEQVAAAESKDAVWIDLRETSRREAAAVTEALNPSERMKSLLEAGEKVATIVFGKKLRRNGTLDSRGTEVVGKTESIYKEMESAVGGKIQNMAIILSGGKSSSYVPRGVRVPTEASVMQNELLSRGVCAKNTFLDEDSYDTIGNVILSYPMVRSFGAKTIVLVAEEPMMDRTYKIAMKVFGDSYELLKEAAKVKLSLPYRVYNRLKERVAYEIFERRFKDVASGGIGEFASRLYERGIYKSSRNE